jgi:hypothetical protein
LTAGQDFLGLGADLPAGVGALGPAVLPTDAAITAPVAAPGPIAAIGTLGATGTVIQ